MDYFNVVPIPNQEANTVADAPIEHWISRFGVPMELHLHQGQNFEL